MESAARVVGADEASVDDDGMSCPGLMGIGATMGGGCRASCVVDGAVDVADGAEGANNDTGADVDAAGAVGAGACVRACPGCPAGSTS